MKQSLTKILVSVQNAQLIKKSFLFEKYYNMILLDFLWDQGFLKNFFFLNINCFIVLRYKQNQTTFKSFGISSNRNYFINLSVRKLWKIKFVKTLLVLSTTLGIISLIESKRMKIGGKVLAVLN